MSRKSNLPKPKWNKENIQNLIKTRQDAAVRAMLVIFERQTSYEQSAETTSEDNGIGFTGFDAKILSSMVHFYQRNKYLSPKQITVIQKLMPKYWKQLAEIANENESKKSVVA